jgi:RNA polymerase sigma factor (sigma-70 family)
VARRLSEGERITSENPWSYFYGVARNVWRENLARKNVLISLSDDLPVGGAQATPYDLLISARARIEAEVRRECLEKCLAELAPEDRDLIVSYYQYGGGVKIENRKRLAANLGLSGNTLRQKVARLRSRIAECVIICQRSGRTP